MAAPNRRMEDMGNALIMEAVVDGSAEATGESAGVVALPASPVVRPLRRGRVFA